MARFRVICKRSGVVLLWSPKTGHRIFLSYGSLVKPRHTTNVTCSKKNNAKTCFVNIFKIHLLANLHMYVMIMK